MIARDFAAHLRVLLSVAGGAAELPRIARESALDEADALLLLQRMQRITFKWRGGIRREGLVVFCAEASPDEPAGWSGASEAEAEDDLAMAWPALRRLP
jgi:hypothetical protein